MNCRIIVCSSAYYLTRCLTGKKYAYSKLSVSPHNRSCLSMYTKYLADIFVWLAFDLQSKLRKTHPLTILSVPFHKTQSISPFICHCHVLFSLYWDVLYGNFFHDKIVHPAGKVLPQEVNNSKRQEFPKTDQILYASPLLCVYISS